MSMTREVMATFGGEEYHLLFNAAVMFAEQEQFSEGGMIEDTSKNSADGLDALARAFCLLAEQGELARRSEGYEPRPIPRPDTVRPHIGPYDVLDMRKAVIDAVVTGYKRDVPDEEVDLVLAELEKKTN